MKIRSDREGNSSFGREMLTAGGRAVPSGRCERCEKELTVAERRMQQTICSTCVERQK